MESLCGRRIVHVASYGGAHGGSFADAMRALARAVTARGGRFELLVPPVPNAGWYDHVREAGGRVDVVTGARTAFATLVRRNPDVVHAHFYGYVVPAAVASLVRRARFVWHVHTSTAVEVGRRGRIKDRVRWRLVAAAGGTVVAVNGALAAQLQARGGPPDIVVVRNAIDTARFRPPSDDERAAARATLGIGDDRRVVLFFGRDPYVKGSDALLQALQARPDVTLVAIAMPDEQVERFSAAVATVAHARYDDARVLHWAADVLALPSRFEAAPFALMEALACGTPAIASDLPTVRETAAGSAAVTYVAPGDGAALRAAFDRPPQLRGADAAVRAHFDLDRWVDDVLALYGDDRPARTAKPARATI